MTGLQEAPLWPQDHAFLEVFEQLNKQNLEHFEEIKIGSKETLSRLESNLVLEVCYENNWILASDDGPTEECMLNFFSGVRDFLSTSPLFGPLSALANSSAIPGVDHPHPVGASRWMHLALRWMELQPRTFHRLLCEAYPDGEIPESIQTSVEELFTDGPRKNSVHSSISSRSPYPKGYEPNQ